MIPGYQLPVRGNSDDDSPSNPRRRFLCLHPCPPTLPVRAPTELERTPALRHRLRRKGPGRSAAARAEARLRLRLLERHCLGQIRGSPRHCLAALEVMGPRQMTGLSSSGRSRLIDMTLMPVLVSTGIMPCSGPPRGRSRRPNSLGMLGPVMSASRRPTRWPARLRATDRRAATDDLPTPPLPLITA